LAFFGLVFQAEAARRKVDLKRFDGDGLGTLPNGKKTPQHSDLVFQVNMAEPCTKGYKADPK